MNTAVSLVNGRSNERRVDEAYREFGALELEYAMWDRKTNLCWRIFSRIRSRTRCAIISEDLRRKLGDVVGMGELHNERALGEGR